MAGLNQAIGRIKGIGHHACLAQVAIGIVFVAHTFYYGQAVGGIIEVGGGVAVDDLAHPITHRIVGVVILFAIGVAGAG